MVASSIAEAGGPDRLVFDLGMHQGEDVAYYLHRGFRVVAVDADERLIERSHRAFSPEVERGRLQLVQAAVVSRRGGAVDFHLSRNTVWNSISSQISSREGQLERTVSVPTVDLPTLFDWYGLPLYCKIDLEGADLVVLESLGHAEQLPRFISAETECLGEHEVADDAKALAVLDQLRRLGYTRFKLVDQRSLVVLEPGRSFYPTAERFHPPVESRGLRIIDRLRNPYLRNRRRLTRRFEHHFPHGASGPFGADLEGKWLDYDTARATLLFHRREYFAMRKAVSYGFWCDWHAASAA